MGWEWRRGALIDSRVACLCLAGGVGGGGGALIVIQVARWCLAGGEGWRGSALRVALCSYGWGVVGERDRRYAGGVLGGWWGGKALIDMMVALVCVWRARRVERGWGKGARIDIRVACVLCLASGEVTKVGEVGACASVFGWRFCFWRAGMVVGREARVYRYSGGALCLAGGEGEGGGALIDIRVACC